ncbi:MAG TPA: MATE family efflux transporter [Candidatus Synoicihabitans sp.]|nr:MATE family efflux transporter [Candidatus Synoicihabitans sp.]
MNAVVTEARRTLTLAGPIIVGQVSQMLMGVTDSIMIGHVGKVPLAAAAFANSVFGFVFVCGVGLLVPVSVLGSRAHGAGRDGEGAEWLRHGVALAAGFSLVAMAGMLLLGDQLARFGQPPEVLAAVHPYYEIITFSLLPTLAFGVFRQFAEALNRPLGPMLILLLSVALNVLLNWILIYGHLGAPALGLTGAGWATLISRVASLLVIVVWLRRVPELRRAWPPAGWIRSLQRARFREMLHIGVPAAISLMFEAGAFTAAAIMMGWLGATELAAHQIAISCAAFTFMFPLGLSMAVSMRIARAVGEGRRDRLRAIGYSAQLMSAAAMTTFALTFALAGGLLARGFVDEPEVIALAARLLVVAAIFQLFDGAQVVGVGALRGLADVKTPTLITAVAYWGVSLPVGYWVGVRAGWGALAIWGALAAGLAVAAILLVLRFGRLTREDRGAPHLGLTG